MLLVKEILFHDISPMHWTTLVESSKSATFFQSHTWFNLWLNHFKHTLDKLLILGVYLDEKLIGIGPFAIKEQTIHFLTTTEVEGQTLSDYGDIIVVDGYEREVWKTLIEYLRQTCNIEKFTLNLCYLRENSQSYSLLHNESDFDLEPIDVAPHVVLLDDWDNYLATLAAHTRHEIKRKLRRADREGLSIHLLRSPLSTELTQPLASKIEHHPLDSEFLQAYEHLIHMAHERKQQFYTQKILDFFQELLVSSHVEVLALYQQDRMIANLILFNQPNAVLAYNSMIDQSSTYWSPGVVLFAFAIQHAVQMGKHYFDFLRGNEHYKYQLGATDQQLFCAIL